MCIYRETRCYVYVLIICAIFHCACLWAKKLFCVMKPKWNSLKQTKTQVHEYKVFKKQIDKIQRCHSLCCVVGCSNQKVKGTKTIILSYSIRNHCLWEKEKTGWGKLIVKIGTIKLNDHMKGVWNKEFAEHTFLSV